MRIARVGNGVSEKIRKLVRNGDLSWSDLFYRSKKYILLKIRAEEIDFTRAEVFIGDINTKTRGAFLELNLEHLVHILYTDFLQQIRENLNELKINADTITLKDTVHSLIEKRKIYFPRENKNNSNNRSIIHKRWALLSIDLRRETAQRGEVFLYDAGMVFPDFEMSLEELISILFVDFISQLRRGNQQMLINTLLERFYSHDFD
jgi:hypothetical protein